MSVKLNWKRSKAHDCSDLHWSLLFFHRLGSALSLPLFTSEDMVLPGYKPNLNWIFLYIGNRPWRLFFTLRLLEMYSTSLTEAGWSDTDLQLTQYDHQGLGRSGSNYWEMINCMIPNSTTIRLHALFQVLLRGLQSQYPFCGHVSSGCLIWARLPRFIRGVTETVELQGEFVEG